MLPYQQKAPSENTSEDSDTEGYLVCDLPAWIMNVWLEMLPKPNREMREVAREVPQDLVVDPNNYIPTLEIPARAWSPMLNWTGFGADTPPLASARSLEHHPTEPHVELAAPINHRQESVLQSGPEFRQAEPYNQTQENNTEGDRYNPARTMWSENVEMLDVAWGVVQDQLEDTNHYIPPHDVHAQEWHQMFDEKEVLDMDSEVLRDQIDYTYNYIPPHYAPALDLHQMLNWTGFGADTPPLASARSLEQHPSEPHVELAAPINHQQESVLQSGPEFRQAEPYNQTQFNNVPTAMHTRHLEVRLAPIGLFKGKMIYGAPGDRVPSPVNVHHSEKRKHEDDQQDDERPYIPKPPNAFMVFLKEQRPYVVASHNSPDSATVSMIIGKMWRALSENKRDKYYKEAKRLKQLHIQLYPDWSEKENYGQIRKRVRKSSRRDD